MHGGQTQHCQRAARHVVVTADTHRSCRFVSVCPAPLLLQMTPSLACGLLSRRLQHRSCELVACVHSLTRSTCCASVRVVCAANKCVFCWRHGTNPVGKEWRWQTDDPAYLVSEAMEQHRRMIAAMKGVPGVLPDRLADALKPRHCALSLVGEPIMYPHINEFVRLLHSHGISSFLVSNAQFPDRVQQLQPVTQLYLSIDAATAQSLKQIDRPLFTSATNCTHQPVRCSSPPSLSGLSCVSLFWTAVWCCAVCCSQ